jgi:hypothetical protein
MNATHSRDLTVRPGGRRRSRRRRGPLAAALLALLVLLCLFGSVASANAAAPGKPTAKAPKGTITQVKPTFSWSKASAAAKYELRVYQGSTQVLKKTGLTKLSWKSTAALPANVDLSWKVRGSGAGGVGAWSKSVAFKIVSGGPAKAITAFSFQALSPPVIGAITEADHTIAVTVPFGTGVSDLVATFTTSGAAVKVGGKTQVSGTTSNDFTHPVIYSVTAGDASTQDYAVTVTVSAPTIGQAYGGGVIAYVYQSGDPGYVEGESHGMIAATGDQSSMGIQWSLGTNYVATGATGVALGTGAANTSAIIAAQGDPAISYAAGLARAYTGGGHTDWYLPSKDELRKLYLSKDAIGGSWSARYYWSSSELSPVSAWLQDFSSGHQSADVKQDLQGVHAVRSF